MNQGNYENLNSALDETHWPSYIYLHCNFDFVASTPEDLLQGPIIIFSFLKKNYLDLFYFCNFGAS